VLESRRAKVVGVMAIFQQLLQTAPNWQ